MAESQVDKIIDAFENPSDESSTLLPDENGYSVLSADRNRNRYTVTLGRNISLESAEELLKNELTDKSILGLNVEQTMKENSNETVYAISFILR